MKAVCVVISLALVVLGQDSEIQLAGKKAFQYDVRSGAPAGRAVDGSDSNGGTFGQNSCSATEDHADNWWAVDLGDIYSVTSVTIVNRNDCCDDHLKNFDVSVSNIAPPTSGALTTANLETLRNSDSCIHWDEVMPKVGATKLTCSNYVEGRYLYIILGPAALAKSPDKGGLFLCEVGAFGGSPSTTTLTSTTLGVNGLSASLITVIISLAIGVKCMA